MNLQSSRRLSAIFIGTALSLLTAAPVNAEGPTTSLQSEYLMTLYATLDVKVVGNLRIVNVPSGWVEGPRIKAKLLQPSADWIRVMPDGIGKLDVRGVMQADDDQLIFFSYHGVQQCSKEAAEKINKAELVRAGECQWLTAPTFETKSEKYGWLNAVQAVGKMIEFKRGDHVTFDIFSMK